MPEPRRIRIEEIGVPERERWRAMPPEQQWPHLVRQMQRLEAELEELVAFYQRVAAMRPPPD
jgi:hypothetical protein